MFLVLGGTFIVHANEPAAPKAGWLTCGALFIAMGAVPLLGLPRAVRDIGTGRLRLALLTGAGVAAGLAAARTIA